MSGTDPQTPREGAGGRGGLRPWLRIVLFASLALNLAVAGLVAGFFVMHGDDRGRRGPPRVDRMGGPLTHALTREDRHAIGREIWQEYRKGRPSREAIRAEYAEVAAALRADPFDSARVAESLARQRDFALNRQELGNRLLLERLEAMTPAERAAFADRLEEGMERFDRRRREDRED